MVSARCGHGVVEVFADGAAPKDADLGLVVVDRRGRLLLGGDVLEVRQQPAPGDQRPGEVEQLGSRFAPHVAEQQNVGPPVSSLAPSLTQPMQTRPNDR